MTATPLLTVGDPTDHTPAPHVEIVVPVYNEEGDLERSTLRLHDYLTHRFPLRWLITIADNASTDRTWGIACRLAGELPHVRAVHLGEKGRGRALRQTWLDSGGAVVAYMDVDLSTDLSALLPLVAPLLSGHSDVAIGSRLARGARVVRGPKREVISRSYNLLLRTALQNGFSDAQCGFKAVRADVARVLLPMVEDNGWFFDTELLTLAERNGLRIHEVPVDWVDDDDSRVDVTSTALDDLRGIWRMMRRFAAGEGLLPEGTIVESTPDIPPGLPGQVWRFAGVGAATTALFGLLFVVLAGPLGAVAADVVALSIATVANLAANRRITFSMRGRAGRARHYGAGIAVAALPLMLTVGALVLLAAAGISSLGAQLLAVTAANLIATAGRFVLLRRWVFQPAPRAEGERCAA